MNVPKKKTSLTTATWRMYMQHDQERQLTRIDMDNDNNMRGYKKVR